MSTWSNEIRRIPIGDNNRSVDWCAAQLHRASDELLFAYIQFLTDLRRIRQESARNRNRNQ